MCPRALLSSLAFSCFQPIELLPKDPGVFAPDATAFDGKPLAEICFCLGAVCHVSTAWSDTGEWHYWVCLTKRGSPKACLGSDVVFLPLRQTSFCGTTRRESWLLGSHCTRVKLKPWAFHPMICTWFHLEAQMMEGNEWDLLTFFLLLIFFFEVEECFVLLNFR